MSTTFSSMVKLFLIQCLLTMFLALPFQDASAGISFLRVNVNSYLFPGEEVDLKAKLEIKDNEEVKVLKLRAQGIQENAQLEVIINGEPKAAMNLDYNMKSMRLAVTDKITTLSVKSRGAFLRSAKAIVTEGDQPHPEDIGLTTLLVANGQLK